MIRAFVLQSLRHLVRENLYGYIYIYQILSSLLALCSLRLQR